MLRTPGLQRSPKLDPREKIIGPTSGPNEQRQRMTLDGTRQCWVPGQTAWPDRYAHDQPLGVQVPWAPQIPGIPLSAESAGQGDLLFLLRGPSPRTPRELLGCGGWAPRCGG